MAHRALAIIRRRLFACLTILSLVLCLATVALWVRSYWRSDTLLRYSSAAQSAQAFGMGSNLGELALFAHHNPGPWKQGWNFLPRHSSADETIASFARKFPQGRSAHFLGFGFVQLSNPFRLDAYVAPHWFFALLFAALPAVRLRSILRTRRLNRVGLCQHCGYDLRATPQGGRCPECGHAAAAAPASPRLTAPRPL